MPETKTRKPTVVNAKMGKIIKRLREQAGMTQKELMDIAKFKSTGTISQAERGLCGMNKANVVKLAKIFKVHPSIFYVDEDFSEQDVDDLVEYSRMIKEKRGVENRNAIRQLIRASAK